MLVTNFVRCWRLACKRCEGGQLSPEGGKPRRVTNSAVALTRTGGGRLTAGIEVDVREPKAPPKKGTYGSPAIQRQLFNLEQFI